MAVCHSSSWAVPFSFSHLAPDSSFTLIVSSLLPFSVGCIPEAPEPSVRCFL